MEGKIVFEGKTEKGLDIIIRYPKVQDAKAMCDYINELSVEQTFISFQGRKFSETEELQVIQEALENIQKNHGVKLLAVSDNKLVAVADIDMHTKDAIQHEGTFGISVRNGYRGKGVGKLLMHYVVDEALKNIPQLQILTLGVFSNNFIAIDMYKKLGFIEYGRLPEGVLHKGKYIDHIYMYKKVR